MNATFKVSQLGDAGQVEPSKGLTQESLIGDD